MTDSETYDTYYVVWDGTHDGAWWREHGRTVPEYQPPAIDLDRAVREYLEWMAYRRPGRIHQNHEIARWCGSTTPEATVVLKSLVAEGWVTRERVQLHGELTRYGKARLRWVYEWVGPVPRNPVRPSRHVQYGNGKGVSRSRRKVADEKRSNVNQVLVK